MTDHLTQREIIEKTGRVKASAQERALRQLGYIVIGRNPKGQVQCLAIHPLDPNLRAAKDRGEVVRLNL